VEDQPQRYQVRPGDSLARIAKRFTTSVKALQQANGIRNPNQIRAGQTLLIPGQAATPSRYRVRPGDNLAQVAQRFGTSVSALQQTNSLSNPNHLRAGQTLHIPAQGSTSGTHYRVRQGDTLGKIARLFEVSVQRLMKANSIQDANQIRPGQLLLIPGPAE
jgi:putative chitinase